MCNRTFVRTVRRVLQNESEAVVLCFCVRVLSSVPVSVRIRFYQIKSNQIYLQAQNTKHIGKTQEKHTDQMKTTITDKSVCFVVYLLLVGVSLVFGYQCKPLSGKTRPQNDMLRVE